MTTTDEPVVSPDPQPPPSGGKPKEPVPADGPQKTVLKPLLAAWLKDRDEFISTVKDVSHQRGHAVAWHTTHSLEHGWRILRYAPIGLGRVIRGVWGWVFCLESRSLRREAINANQAKEYIVLEKERKARVAMRWRGTLTGLIVLTVGLACLWFLMPNWRVNLWLFQFTMTRDWLFTAIGVSTVCGLAYVGRPREGERPLIRRAIDISGNPPLRPETVINALVSLRVPGMTKPDEIRLLIDVPSSTSGYLFEMELPPGVTAESVMEKRPELSAALRHPLGTVWPSVGKKHQGHLMLFVGHEDMNAARQKPWPLLKSGQVDIFNPVPLFTDQRNQWVKLTPMYTSGVIGALPRMGKTFILRELLLVGALDPLVKIYAFDFKGTGDLSPLRLVAHRYACTARPEKIAELLPVFEELQEELFRRSEVIEGLPYEECPESKVTPELASRRDLKLEPIMVGVDECHELFEHEESAVRARFIKIFADLVKRGPALGIIVYLATQKPDASSIPTKIGDNAVIRICLKVHGWRSNDAVLGTEAHSRGLKATMFAFEDKGIAYLKGEGAEALIVRSVSNLDTLAAEKVATRARAARELEGRLTGDAAGEEMDTEVEQVILLDDVRRVFGAADAMHLPDIATGLGELRPMLYGNLDPNSLGRQLRRAEVRVDSVHVAGKPREEASRKGVKREWLAVSTTALVGDEEVAGAAADNVRPLRRPTAGDGMLPGEEHSS